MPFITPIETTKLKLRPLDSGQLGANEIRVRTPQEPLGICSVRKAENQHWEVKLAGKLTIGGKQVDKCFIFSGHWQGVTDIYLKVLEVDRKVATQSLKAPPAGVFKSLKKDDAGNVAEVVLNAPYASQVDNANNPGGSCNVSSFSMALRFFSIKQRRSGIQFEDELYEYMETNRLSRHSPQDLKVLAEEYGLTDRFIPNASKQEIKDWLITGRPVIVHGYWTAFGHIAVIVGFDALGWILHDPWGEYPYGDLRNNDANPEKGKYIRYSYGLMGNCCWSDGGCWTHFLDRPGVQKSSTPPPKSDAIAKAVRAMAHPELPEQEILDLINACGEWLPKFGITTRDRIVHFFAQCAHESMGFYWLQEQGDDAYFTKMYEGYLEIGNTEPGDGIKFAGHGLIQVTGRSNHAKVANKTGIDCVNNPKLLTIYPGALAGSLVWWEGNGMNALCDQGLDDADVIAVTKRINGGTTGLNDRLNRTDKLKLIIL